METSLLAYFPIVPQRRGSWLWSHNSECQSLRGHERAQRDRLDWWRLKGKHNYTSHLAKCATHSLILVISTAEFGTSMTWHHGFSVGFVFTDGLPGMDISEEVVFHTVCKWVAVNFSLHIIWSLYNIGPETCVYLHLIPVWLTRELGLGQWRHCSVSDVNYLLPKWHNNGCHYFSHYLCFQGVWHHYRDF